MRELWDLYFTFARIGLFTFGGGLTMLPLLEKEVVEKKQWVTNEELMDYYAIGQCTPGIIAVNTSTFIGHKLKGSVGGIFATLGMVTPSLIIITLIAAFLTGIADNTTVQSAFAAIRIAVSALILNTVVKMWKSNVKSKGSICLSLLALVISLVFDISPIIIVLLSIVLGLILYVYNNRRAEK